MLVYLIPWHEILAWFYQLDGYGWAGLIIAIPLVIFFIYMLFSPSDSYLA